MVYIEMIDEPQGKDGRAHAWHFLDAQNPFTGWLTG